MTASYLATKPEVGFRDQGFVIPEVESLRVHSCGFLKKLYPQEELDISLSIVNSKSMLLYSHFMRVLTIMRGSAPNTHSNDFIRS